MTRIFEDNGRIILENQYVELVFSSVTGRMISAVDRKADRPIGFDGDTPLCFFKQKDKSVEEPEKLVLRDGVLTAIFGSCEVKLAVKAEETYFTVEVIGGLSADFYEFVFVSLQLREDDVTANGIAMTVQTQMIDFPNMSHGRVYGSCQNGLEPLGAKMGIAIAPLAEQREILKKIMMAVDPEKGIVSRAGGPWGNEFSGNSGNCAIVYTMDPAYYETNLSTFVKYGVDQIDFHQGYGFGQGDFAFFREGGPENFKREIADPFKKLGISCGFHTYSMYIRYKAATILSDPVFLCKEGPSNPDGFKIADVKKAFKIIE